MEQGISELGKLVAAIDSQIRLATIKAHADAIKAIAELQDVSFGDFTIPARALAPRELFEASSIALEFTLRLRDDSASLSTGKVRRGNAKLSIQWKATPAPEAAALVRVKAEATVDQRLRTVKWTELTPATPVEEDDG